jgi:hypothetical protein
MMRARFNQSFKIQAVKKAFSRSGDTTLKEVADSLGVGHSTLNSWMVQSRRPEFESIKAAESLSLGLMSKEKRPQDWSLEEKLKLIIACGPLDDEAVNAVCREQGIIKLVNEPAYADMALSQIVPTLADKGRYIDSESTLYRILKDEKQLHHRQKSRLATAIKKPRALTATGANQIYTLDITYLPKRVRGVFLYLYVVMDIYSRKIVGWQVHDEERSALAVELMTDICQREGIKRHQVTLHSDNGSPMKGATMLAT